MISLIETRPFGAESVSAPILDHAKEGRAEIVREGGQAVAVVIPVAAYERLKDRMHIVVGPIEDAADCDGGN